MNFSIITVTKNSRNTIQGTVSSVLSQKAVTLEHILKDCMSLDDTVAIAKATNPSITVIQKPDSGIYDGMNQGYAAANGEIIAFLNSDDYYPNDHVLADVHRVFVESNCDYVYGNVDFINSSQQIARRTRPLFDPTVGIRGTQIPHPAFFVRKYVLDSITPVFDTSYRIAADLKQQLRIANERRYVGRHLDETLAIVRIGGASTRGITSYASGWRESTRAYDEVMGGGGIYFVVRKVLSKFRGLTLG